MPLISICLPTLNARPFLEERMRSIYSQTLEDWELIVCDSYSNDGTWEYMQRFRHDSRVRLHQVPKEGLYAGWNECLRRARGEYIHIATADDTCDLSFLDALIKSLNLAPSAGLVFCDYSEIDEASQLIKRSTISNREQFFNQWAGQVVEISPLYAFTASCHLVPLWNTMSAVAFRRRLLDKIGLFPREYGSCGDVFWALAASATAPVVYHGANLATWRLHSNQATRRQPRYVLQFQIAEAMKDAFNLYGYTLHSNWSNWYQSAQSGVTYYAETCKREILSLDHSLLRNRPTEFFVRLFWSLKYWPSQIIRQLLSGFKRTEAPPVLRCLDKALRSVGAHPPIIHCSV